VFELAKQRDLFIKTIMAHVGAISQSATWFISFRNADLNNVRDKSNFALFIFLKIKRATVLGLDYLRKKFFVIAVIVSPRKRVPHEKSCQMAICGKLHVQIYWLYQKLYSTFFLRRKLEKIFHPKHVFFRKICVFDYRKYSNFIRNKRSHII